MNNNLTELVMILDRSGSMAPLVSDTVGEFNGMMEKQKKEEGECLVTTVLFDTEQRTLHDRIPLSEVPVLTEKDYAVGGCTALFDAIGTTVEHIRTIHRYIRPEDIPGHTLLVITTDGLENASKQYSRAAVRELIETQKRQGWEFLFIGANIDAVEEARTMGISEDRAVKYVADEEGTKTMFCCIANTVGKVRKSETLSSDWCKPIAEDRKKRKKQ